MTVLYAKNLTLKEVQAAFNFQRESVRSFASLLTLEPITEFEQQELIQIRDNFSDYVFEGKVLEGMVKALTVFPLLRLTGYYQRPIKLKLEENIAPIDIEDEDTQITGRFDLLAVNKESQLEPLLWILIAEAKNSEVAARAGLAQVLTYAYSHLGDQNSVWGLSTNGMEYQFVYIQQGNPPTYSLLPLIDLIDPNPSILLIQVLKAISSL